MNPVTKAITSAVVRWLMTIAGTHGVDTSGVVGEDLAGALNAVIDGVLIIVPIVWSAIHKVKVDKKING